MDFDQHLGAVAPGCSVANPVSVLAVMSLIPMLIDSQILLIVNIDLWINLFLAGTGKSDEKVDLTRENKLAQFNNWFTWCHNCRHGGHAGHMLSWFRWDSLDAAHV